VLPSTGEGHLVRLRQPLGSSSSTFSKSTLGAISSGLQTVALCHCRSSSTVRSPLCTVNQAWKPPSTGREFGGPDRRKSLPRVA
jgi:hypothetical protein